LGCWEHGEVVIRGVKRCGHTASVACVGEHFQEQVGELHNIVILHAGEVVYAFATNETVERRSMEM
jgi:hypothetical protein